MDRNFIKIMIEEGTKFSDLPQEKAFVLLNNQLVEVYVKNGLHRTMTDEKFNEEIKIGAGMLYKDITEDKVYRTIRDTEFHYIFSEGMKGRLGADKDIVITHKSILRWLEGYVNHIERKETARMYFDERKHAPKQLSVHEMTDDDYKRSINEVFKEYCEYRRKLEERSKAMESGVKRKLLDFHTIGDVLGPPIGLNDYGGFRMGWLVKNGYAKKSEKLVDVFARAISNKGKFLKLNNTEK